MVLSAVIEAAPLAQRCATLAVVHVVQGRQNPPAATQGKDEERALKKKGALCAKHSATQRACLVAPPAIARVQCRRRARIFRVGNGGTKVEGVDS